MEYSYVSITVTDYIIHHNQILNNLTSFDSTLYSEKASLTCSRTIYLLNDKKSHIAKRKRDSQDSM